MIIAHPIFAKGGELPQESYISLKKVGNFHLLFVHCSHPYMYIFNISIGSEGTHERITKICVSKCQILKFLWDLENRQNWI